MARASILLWALTAALAGFLFGFDTAVISGAEQAVQRTWQTSNAVHGLAISAALWGTVIGALLGAWPSDRFGRRATLIVIGILYAVSAAGSALAWDPYSFMIFRFIGGIGVGASSIAAPAYISEIAPAAKRGRLVALFQTMIVVGILVAFLSNYLIGSALGKDGWRIMLGAEILPALAYLLAVFFIPESPRWLLVKRGDEAAARSILSRISPGHADETLTEIRQTSDQPSVSLKTFFSGKYAVPIMLAFLLAAFNQLSGINAIIYYAPRIFELTGAADNVSLLATVGIGAVNLVFTLIGLALIDRAGRRSLMLIGSIGYIVSLSMVAYGFAAEQYTLVPYFIFAFIAAHAVGQGAVIWVYISEIFPTVARAKGQALGSGTHWVLAAILTLVMPAILTAYPAVYIFAFFTIMMCLQLLFTLFMMVETRGRSLEELGTSLRTGRPVSG